MAKPLMSGPAAPLRADDVRWLVDFARRSGIDELGFEEAALLCRHVVSITLTGRWDGAVHLLQEEAGFTPRELIGWVPSSLRLADNRGHEARVAWLAARQQDVVGPLSALETSAPYTLEATAMVFAPTADGAATLRYGGSLDEAFACIVLHAFAAQASSFGACKSPKCGGLFLPADRRQKYCSTACGQSVRWARFVTNKRGPKARRGRAKSAK
jgi:hypothetical protein